MKKLSEVKLPQEFMDKVADKVNYTSGNSLPPECYYY
jgi:hypothetical protein